MFLSKRIKSVERWEWGLWGVVAFVVPFYLHYIQILNSFYHFGSGFGDAGLFAQIVWRNEWWLKVPLSYEPRNISFLAMHFTPWLVVLNQLSYLVPTSAPEFYAVYIASAYAVFSLALFLFLSVIIEAKNQIQIAGITLLSVLFAFNQTVIDGIWYVHIEYMIPAGILLFLFLYTQGYARSALAVFIFTMLQREDAGLHFATVLGTYTALYFWKTRSWAVVRPLVMYVALALWFSALLLGSTYVTIAFFGGRSTSNWELMYSGSGFFDHLTFALVWERLQTIFNTKTYMWAGLLMTLGFSIYKRNPYYAVGVVSCLPWFFINLIAVQSMNSLFQAYYTFPFVVALIWPVVSCVLPHNKALSQREIRDVLCLQAALIVIALFAWKPATARLTYVPAHVYGSFFVKPGLDNRNITKMFVEKIKAGAGDLGRVAADEATLALIGGEYQGGYMRRSYSMRKGSSKGSSIDTALYFIGGEAAALKLAKRNDLTYSYCITSTPICMFTNRAHDRLGALAPLFVPHTPKR